MVCNVLDRKWISSRGFAWNFINYKFQPHWFDWIVQRILFFFPLSFFGNVIFIGKQSNNNNNNPPAPAMKEAKKIRSNNRVKIANLWRIRACLNVSTTSLKFNLKNRTPIELILKISIKKFNWFPWTDTTSLALKFNWLNSKSNLPSI